MRLMSALLLLAVCLPLLARNEQQAPASPPAPADITRSGSDFLHVCRDADLPERNPSAPISADTSNCYAYLQGFVAGAGMADAYHSKKHKAKEGVFCIPPDATMGRVVRTVKDQIEEEPEYGKAPTSYVLAETFMRTFPCVGAR